MEFRHSLKTTSLFGGVKSTRHVHRTQYIAVSVPIVVVVVAAAAVVAVKGSYVVNKVKAV